MEITQDKLNKMLMDHKKWLEDRNTGARFEFHGNLQHADLQYANLQGANIDFSCWPLCCGSGNVKIDDRQMAQLINHVLVVNHPLVRKLRKLKTVISLAGLHPESEKMWREG